MRLVIKDYCFNNTVGNLSDKTLNSYQRFILFSSGSSITTNAANPIPSNYLTSAQQLGFPGHHVRQPRQSGFGANNANSGAPSESVAEQGTSAFDVVGQIGLLNSEGGINAGRLNEESFQSVIQMEFDEGSPLGQEKISETFSTPNNQRGSATLINETIKEDINPSRVIIEQVFEEREEIVEQLVSQEVIIHGRNITHIVAGPINGFQQESLQTKNIQLGCFKTLQFKLRFKSRF